MYSGPFLVGRTCSHHERNISVYSSASLVPLGKKNVHGGVVCLCCVFCVYVLMCDVVYCRRCDVNGCSTQQSTICKSRQITPQGIYVHYGFI